MILYSPEASLISEVDWSLFTFQALEEIKMNWEQLSDEQRDYIPVRDIDDLYA